MSKYEMLEFMSITKALADENRVRVLLALEKGELCVCQIVELLDLAPSTVSKHMAILKQARLVDSRKEGRWIYYRLTNDGPASVQKGLDWVSDSLSEAPEIVGDRKRLKEIACIEPGDLVQIQKARS